MRCPDCGSRDVAEPDHEGMVDCYNCGAAWIPPPRHLPPETYTDPD